MHIFAQVRLLFSKRVLSAQFFHVIDLTDFNGIVCNLKYGCMLNQLNCCPNKLFFLSYIQGLICSIYLFSVLNYHHCKLNFIRISFHPF